MAKIVITIEDVDEVHASIGVDQEPFVDLTGENFEETISKFTVAQRMYFDIVLMIGTTYGPENIKHINLAESN